MISSPIKSVISGFESMENELEKRIKEAVKPYMGMPIAISGGIDSGLLAALIKPKFAISVDVGEIEYAKKIAEHLKIKHIIVKPDDDLFDESMKIAVKIIGRVIPHFDIFPRYEMYKVLHEMDIKELVLGDAPDETMCGYARDLIINYLYKVYDFEAFKNYKSLIDKILPPKVLAIEDITGKKPINATEDISLFEMLYMRPDMDDMSDKLAKHFGIKNLRPYQDNRELDNFMYELPIEEKIYNVEYGKYALRKIAEKYLPKEIAWRKEKVGMFYPVNKIKGWLEIDGEFGKTQFIKYQENILWNSQL